MLSLEPRVSFSSNFASFFNVMKHNFCIFWSKSLYALDKRSSLKCKFSDFQLFAWNLTKFLMSFFKPKVSFKFCITLQCHDIVPLEFFNWNIVCFGQKEPSNAQFFILLSALMKVYPIHHAIFKTTSSGYIQILHHFLHHWFLCIFLAQTSHIYFGQKYPSKWNFLTFQWLGENSQNSSCYIWNQKSYFL